MPATTLKTKPESASSKVKPKIDTVRLEKLITQCLLTDVPLSILTESYDISYKQMGLLINMTQGFERQTSKMDHTFDSFTYEAIPEDYFAIPHILPEEKHFSHEKMMELFAELEEIKSKKALIVSIDPNFIKEQIQKQKEKLASYDPEKISNIQGFINEFDAISLHRQPTPEIFLHLLEKYNLNIQEKDSLNQLYDEYLNDQNKLLKLEQELTRQQQQERELSKLDRRYRQIRDELVIHNIKLVNWCIRRFFNGIPLPKEDAQACGLEGLSNALNLFDYKKGFHFSTYAVPAIVHTIQRNFKDLTGYKWEDYIKINAINYYRNLMKTESGTDHTPTAEELANMGLIDMSATQIRKYDEIERYGRIEPLSSVHEEPESEYPTTRRYEMPMTQEDYDAIDEYEDSVSAVSYVLGPITSAEVSDQAYSVIARRTIFEVLKTLTPREQLAIEQAFGLVDGKFRTLEETGKAFNVSRERTRQIIAKGLRKLRHPSRAKYLRDFVDMDFADVDPIEYRPQSHIDIEKIYSDYYLLSDLDLDETTVIEKLARENRGHNGYDIEYLLKKLPLIQESIISQACESIPFDQICFRIYDYYGTLFSIDFIINILNKNREKLPTIVQTQLDDFLTKKM